MNSRIYILTGPVRSGKTTLLQQWAQSTSCKGILTPDVGGIRMMVDISTGNQSPFEVIKADGTKEVQSIGRFRFYTDAFETGNKLISSALKGSFDWLVIDEIGPLELKGQGFDQGLKTALAYFNNLGTSGKLLLVVRDSLLAEVIDHYSIQSYQLFNHNL